MSRMVDANPFGILVVFAMLGSLGMVSLILSRSGAEVGFLIGLGMGASVIVVLWPRIAIYLLIFSMLLSPEFGVGGLATAGSAAGRGVTFRLDDFLLVVVVAVWLIKAALYKELGIFKKTPFNGAMLFYIVACALSTLIGVAAGRVQPMTGSLFVLKYTQYFVLFLMVINNIDNEKDLRRYWIAVLVTAILVGAVGLAQIPTGGRVTAPFEGERPEPNTFGGYLAFLILICTALSLTLRQHRQRIFYFLVALYLLVPFLFTLSRASYLGFVPGLAVVLFLGRQRLLSYMLVVILLVAAIVPEMIPRVVRYRISQTWSQRARPGQAVVFGQRLDTSTSVRLRAFQQVLHDFQDRPFFGYGVTGWRFIDSQYFRTLIETGLFGLLALLFLFFRLFQLGFQRLRSFAQDSYYRGMAIGFLGGLVCLLFHAVGSNTFIIVRIMEPFWLIVALLFMSGLVASQTPLDEQRKTPPLPA